MRMTQVSSDEIVLAVTRATHEVFSMMLGLPLEAGQPHEESVNKPSVDGVVALVGVAGRWTGSGRISCSSQFAAKLAGALLSTDFAAVNEDVLDAVAEVSNMIIGNVKTHFEQTLGPLGLSIPTVVFGRNYQTRCTGVRHWTVVPFTCEGDSLEVCFFLVQSMTQANSMSRPELARA